MTPSPDRDVVIVRHGTLSTTRGAMIVDREPGRAAEPLRLDYYFWAVLDPAGTVLIDCGYSADEAAARGRSVVRRPDEVFAALGLDERWAGDVVLTHLHYDHTGAISRFPRAHLHVTDAEVAFRRTGGCSDEHLTSATDLAELSRADADGRLHRHAGAVRLRDGIDLIPAPGHTPGQLMVRVETRGGIVLLASDAAHFDEEYLDDRPFTSMTDPDAALSTYAELRRRRSRGEEIVTGHEAGLIDRYAGTAEPYGPETALIRVAPRRATPEEGTSS
jgi:glyoxylase-like metal-dependent hydrolase (beta-lactamase superfamily II)